MGNDRDKRNGAPGALGLGQALATRIYCAFHLLYYTTPLFFAMISDTFLGHFMTLCIYVVLYALGCGIIIISPIDSSLDAGLGIHGLAAGMIFVG
jgi:POT family proton-dependent oligopeptide transporter